jgi:phospholipase C
MISRRNFLSLLGVTAAGVTSGCQGIGDSGVIDPNTETPQTPTPSGLLKESIQHIVFSMQENRSFDHYFGMLPQYRASKGIPGTVEGLPANASNPAADDPTQVVTSHHLSTSCHENLSPSWNETHVQYNRNQPTAGPAMMDGFVYTAAKFSRNNEAIDTEGHRAMGYYTEADLPYYYELASQFAISDHYFSSSPAATLSNRLFYLAGSAFGRVYPDFPDPQQYDAKTIFDLLEAAGVSWKIYLNGDFSYYQWFTGYNANSAKVVDAEQYFVDLDAGTLPAVAMVESGTNTGLDEHPKNNIQSGARYMSRVINALMASSAWKNSVFILNYDEAGGFFDHMPPPSAPKPDGIEPFLQPNDVRGSFDRYGFRVPLIMVSPWARKNYVSKTVADHTSVLKFIETRFDLPSLTARDAAAHDLTDMLDFAAMSFETPPQMPEQPETGVCDWQLAA